MPAAKRQPAKTKPKPKGKAKTKAKAKVKQTTPQLDGVDEPSESRIVEKAAPAIIQSFETATALPEGHCIIRKLEDGSYEIINLTSATPAMFGSQEVGRLILEDETGGRMRALEDVEKSWKDSELKLGQVLGSANLRIFRFLKLPLELRYMIYDLTIGGNARLRLGSWQYSPDSILPGIQLRGTCKQIYEETSTIFWRNRFRISDICRRMKPLLPKLIDNVQELSWAWWNFKIKDANTLRAIQEFKKLRILNIELTEYCVDSPVRPNSSRQFLHQQEPSIAKFNKTSGFDLLIGMRGLERVTVTNSASDSCKIKPSAASDAEIRAFEVFVNRELTQPKETKEDSASASSYTKKAVKKRQRQH
ncbi:hypothetical protein BKA65DRAFT_488199 [Rhexocercosporidium sp. MPI-PUGE-AT-0058]|nr:hypothetical protein BKA65DRAFT_488199 [Rhexocercosporidium sp. MPI-PUGE-AT-0058]